MASVESRNYKLIITYYAVMLGALVLLMRPEASYSLPIRLVYFGMIVLPLYFYTKLIPAVVTCFWGVCSNSFYALLPDNYLFLIAVIFAFFIMRNRKINLSSHILTGYILLLLYTGIICLVFDDINQNFLKVLLLFLFIYPFLEDKDDIFFLSMGICVMSFALALIYLRNFSYFMVYEGTTDFEIGAWGNKNVLAGAVSCGFPIALAILVGIIRCEKSRILNIFLISSMVLISVVLFSAGSRGSLLAVAVSSVLLLFSSRGSVKNKVLILILLVVLLLSLYNMGRMDYFIYRMTELDTTETAGGRTDIWITKITAFFSTDLPTILFGMGRTNCEKLGVVYSTHNDIVTSLVAFGFIGLILFLTFILKPLFLSKKASFKTIFALWAFVFMESIVLEPFFRGYVSFYAFYFLLLKMAFLQKKEKLSTSRNNAVHNGVAIS